MKSFIKTSLVLIGCAIFAVVGIYGLVRTHEEPMLITKIIMTPTYTRDSRGTPDIVYTHAIFAVDDDGELWEIPSTQEHELGEFINVIWQRGDIAIKGE